MIKKNSFTKKVKVADLSIDDHVALAITPKSIATPFAVPGNKDAKGIKISPYNFRRFEGKEGSIAGTIGDIKMTDSVIEYISLEKDDFTYMISPSVIVGDPQYLAKPYKG